MPRPVFADVGDDRAAAGAGGSRAARARPRSRPSSRPTSRARRASSSAPCGRRRRRSGRARRRPRTRRRGRARRRPGSRPRARAAPSSTRCPGGACACGACRPCPRARTCDRRSRAPCRSRRASCPACPRRSARSCPSSALSEARLADVRPAEHGDADRLVATPAGRVPPGSSLDDGVEQIARAVAVERGDRDGLAEAERRELVATLGPRTDRRACSRRAARACAPCAGCR